MSASIYAYVYVCVWPHPTLPARSFQNHFKFNTKSQTMTKVVQDVRSVDRERERGEWGGGYGGTHIENWNVASQRQRQSVCVN